VPVYNTEDYLPKCLDSLVNQTLEDIEIIVVNDGSTDHSSEIIREYENRYPSKIKGFSKINGGLSDARNFGLKQATGKYIGFVDSDDYVSHKMYEEMYSLAEKHDCQMVLCNLQKVDEKEYIIRKLEQIPHLPLYFKLEDHLSVFSDISYFACNKIFKKSLFEGEEFSVGMHFEDIELIPKILLKCNKIGRSSRYHYQYLERQNSISKKHNFNGLDILKAVESVEKAFLQSQYKNEKKALRGFQILEGVYTFLAYLAFVKQDEIYFKMSQKLRLFIKERQIKIWEILKYRRFKKNYLLSLPARKKIYYLLYFSGAENLIRKLMK